VGIVLWLLSNNFILIILSYAILEELRMFAFIKGRIIAASGSVVTIEDKTGCIGYAVQVAQPHLFAQGTEVIVYTYLHWNQEQGPTLFGFLGELEKSVFLLIIGCSGIGPKIGLAVLAELAPVQFLQAVQEGNIKALSAVSGIGPKKAEQIILYLKDKVSKLITTHAISGSEDQSDVLAQWNNISQVLQSLNYSKGEIEAAMRHVGKECAGKNLPFEELLRKALSFLSKKR
jgi:Holliday junction DNA helicase RuvA